MNKIQLFPHQQKALESTKDFNRVAYYLDMGLGKTFVGAEKMMQLDSKTNLIVCQKSKIDDWIQHLKTYYSNIGICNLSDKKGYATQAKKWGGQNETCKRDWSYCGSISQL